MNPVQKVASLRRTSIVRDKNDMAFMSAEVVTYRYLQDELIIGCELRITMPVARHFNTSIGMLLAYLHVRNINSLLYNGRVGSGPRTKDRGRIKTLSHQMKSEDRIQANSTSDCNTAMIGVV